MKDSFEEIADSMCPHIDAIAVAIDKINNEDKLMKPQRLNVINIPAPTTQIDIAILSDGKCITETTIDVFAEWDDGDKSTGTAEGWIINSIMLGKCDITNEMDLTEIQEYLKEAL